MKSHAIRVSGGAAVLVAMTISFSLISRGQAPAAESLAAPFPPAEEASRMKLPPGFRCTLFAGEPDLVQPIAFAFDDRGRLWVVENYSYPNWQTDGKLGHDRILIFDDPDSSGHFKSRKVFWDQGSNLSGLALGFGGIWLCSTPNLIFIPIKDGEDKPAGPPQVVLDGWSLEARHNVFNRLEWGPDGWLYGLNGILSDSKVGKPGTPEKERVPLNCGVWRYHPTRHVFEAFAWGTTNPWGLDFDDRGQIFITNCVIKHLWHVIPGAHFQRMYGEDLNPNTYGLIESCADHIHWGGGDWTDSRGGFGKHSEAGGGHAHAGAMVYLGDNFPDTYRDSIFMCNIHGNRVNNDILEHVGSGYVGHHGKDFMLSDDTWFRGLDLHYGPDGGVFVSDWCDTGECHNYSAVDRSNGRIYKVTYGDAKAVQPFDLAHQSDEILVQLQTNKNHWWSRHAQRLLQERAASGKLDPGTRSALEKIVTADPDIANRLRAIWSLYVIGGLDDQRLESLLDDGDEYVRGWAIQLVTEQGEPSAPLLAKFEKLSRSDPSPVVRLYLASALQRLPAVRRWAIAAGLANHAEDAKDQNLPLMIWYGIEGAVPLDSQRAVDLMHESRIPLIRQYTARRLSSGNAAGLASVVEALNGAGDLPQQLDLLRGIVEGLKDQRTATPPKNWNAAAQRLAHSNNADVEEMLTQLSLKFGDPLALASLRTTVASSSIDVAARQRALQSLVQYGDPELATLLKPLLSDHELARSALRALAACPGNETPRVILEHYKALSSDERGDAIDTLASRPQWALAMLDALESGLIARGDISTLVVRQLLTLKDPKVDAKVAKVWGVVRGTTDSKKNIIAKFKATYTPEAIRQADLPNGRVVFNRVCAQCHTLFDSGGRVGPNLTGSQRSNLNYLFENVLDPSAVVAKEYLMTVVELNDGRVVNGIVQSETPNSLTLRTPKEDLILAKSDIDNRKTSTISMMPEGLLEALSAIDCRDLIGYLGSPTQTPLKQQK